MTPPESTPAQHPPEWASGPPSEPEQPVPHEAGWDLTDCGIRIA
jgi:hypothetical protein